jgi:pyridoxamine 5'-phosphate oxidase
MSLWSPPPEDSPRRLADLRVTYDAGTLDEAALLATPLAQFHAWFDAALEVGLPEPNAMIVASASADGQPSARTVLLKDADPRGFVFFTNYGSRKGEELTANPKASCVFPWFAMHRQVVVVGAAERLDREESLAYFTSRPHGSRLGAWASRQSEVIPDREVLETRYDELAQQYPEGTEVPIPDFWGGWLIRPVSVEFWQGRPSRLHDRLRFRASDGRPGAALDEPAGWVVERLSP